MFSSGGLEVVAILLTVGELHLHPVWLNMTNYILQILDI